MSEPSLAEQSGSGMPPGSLSPLRAVFAVAIALLGSVIVWVVVPYNNFRFKNSYLADSFLPEIVVALLLLLILAVNPLLRFVRPDWVLKAFTCLGSGMNSAE